MSHEQHVDVVVLGVGPGGEQAARQLARAGLDTVAVDQALIGGECPFWGCTPSKLMIRPSEVLAEARRAPGFAGEVDVRPDWGPVAARIREVTDDWHDTSHAENLEEHGVRIVRGHGRLDGPGRVVVETEDGPATLVASRGVLLNTGTEPARLPIEGLEHTPYWSNREVMKATAVPERLVVVGGGPNGVELAQAFARFGSQVTLVEASDRVMGPEEPEASRLLAEVMRREGIEIRENADVTRVDHDGTCFTLTVDGDPLICDQLLVAAGRHLNLDHIGLDTLDVRTEEDGGALVVDERMRAGERLWAIGDITGKGAFTHVSHYQATIAVRDLTDADGPWADYHAVTRVTFTDPEIASVGMSEHQAREAGLAVAVGWADLDSSPRGWIHGPGNDGFVKLVADLGAGEDDGVLVGGCLAGPYAGELLGLVSAAVHARTPLGVLREMHFPFPTFQGAIEIALRDLRG